MSFNIISHRWVEAIAVRPDSSSSYLSRYKGQGYAQVVFVANFKADPDCAHLDGNVYEIDDLLTYDDPLFRTSHINCVCSFEPLEESLEKEQEPDVEEILEGEQFKPVQQQPTTQVQTPQVSTPAGIT